MTGIAEGDQNGCEVWIQVPASSLFQFSDPIDVSLSDFRTRILDNSHEFCNMVKSVHVDLKSGIVFS